MKSNNNNNNNESIQPYDNEVYANELAYDLTKAALEWVGKNKISLVKNKKSPKDWINIVEQATYLFTVAIARASIEAEEEAKDFIKNKRKNNQE